MPFKLYHHLLTRRPILTQVVTTAVMFGAGDVIAQRLIEKNQMHDYKRTLRIGAYGLFIAGPAMSLWYRQLNRLFPSTNTTRKASTTTVLKVACDQVLFSPVFIGVFYTYNGAMEGLTTDDIKEKLSSSYWTTLKANYFVWPAVQFFNFKVVPLNYQTLLVNGVALGWNSYLSFMNQKSISAAASAARTAPTTLPSSYKTPSNTLVAAATTTTTPGASNDGLSAAANLPS